MNAAELLENTLSPDANTRQNATAELERASQQNYPVYAAMMSAELANENQQFHIRNAAGLALKNSLTAREAARLSEYTHRWLAVDPDTRSKVKNNVMITLASPTQKAGGVAAQVVAAIAAVELPANQWLDLIETLLSFMGRTDNTNLRISTLQTIGYTCESIRPDVLSARSNEILTAVIHGARKDEPSPEVQVAAINALYNSLEFVSDNFEREGERNYIMQVVCEATQNGAVPVQVGAFECLVRIMSLYYDKMAFYMEQALFGLTVLGMKSSEETIAQQAVEFWSTVCEEEIELAIEAAEAMEYGEMPEQESRYFAKTALPEIIPVLMTILTHQDEDADEDEWNVSMAAGTCVSLLAQAVGDSIVPAVIPFIEANIKSPDWHHREASVMTFGSILDGPDPTVTTPLVTQALPILIDMMHDSHLMVKDTTSWTLGRICDLLIVAIKPDVHLHPLVSGLVGGLQDNPRIIANCCWALMNLSDQLGLLYEDDGQNAQSGPLSPYYEGIIQALLRVTEGTSNESNFRTSAYEAITSYVTHAPADVIPVVQQVTVAVLTRMEQLLHMHNQLLGVDDRNNWNELQGNLCSVVIGVVRKLGDGIEPLADRIMTLILQVIQVGGKSSTVLEDGLLVIGTMASALEQKFVPYIQAVLPLMWPALQAHQDTQLCTVAIGLIGDIARALGDQTTQYAADFMNVLLTNLSSETLNRDVKIPILSCFGDIAFAVGPGFEPYLNATMHVLAQAGALNPDPLDYALVDYASQLREGILEAYTGIVAAFKDTDQASVLLPHAPTILELVQRAMVDDEKTESIVKLAMGLVGDLAATFSSGQIKQLLLAEWLAASFRPGVRVSVDTRKTIRWAKEMVKRATA